MNKLPIASPAQAATLVDLLRHRSEDQSESRGYRFVVEAEAEGLVLSYAELDRRARAIAAQLQRTVAPGERALLLYPPGLDYIAAFFGCLYAGCVAVPAYPPRPNRSIERLQAISSNAQASVVLTLSHSYSRMRSQLAESPELARLPRLTTDQTPTALCEEWKQPELDGSSLALLQYTSGSTGSPKGVMVSHANLLHNQGMIRRAFQQDEHAVIVGWLPLYHDMGLIGNVIQPLYVNANCILMSPGTFLQSPFRWLEAISRYRATTSGGPNFAYELCVRRVSEEQLARLDLGSWRVAFNGAEPVRTETIEAFATKFAACGFRREAFHPCYGLAEATLLVSGGRLSREGEGNLPPFESETVDAPSLARRRVVELAREDKQAKTIISCGDVAPEQNIAIVNPETLARCQPDEVGEIWIQGASVASGYWNLPAETDETFQASINGTGEAPFLRTGDLGFLRGGQLYVTGRIKDLIIIRGVNHYPQDIERTVAGSHTELVSGGGAAFSFADDGEERLVVVQEVMPRRKAELSTVLERIRQAIGEGHELAVSAILLIKAGTLPKTSSGKVQRHLCQKKFREDSFEVLAQWRESSAPQAMTGRADPDMLLTDRESLEAWLAAQLAARLNIDPVKIDVERPLAQYGLDSLAGVEMQSDVENYLGIVLPLTSFLQGDSLSHIAQEILRRAHQQSGASRLELDGALPAFRLTTSPTSHGQRALWFLHQLAPDSVAYHISRAVRVKSPLDIASLERVMEKLSARHASLRTSFDCVAEEPVQHVHERGDVVLRVVDASTWTEDQLRAALDEESTQPFDLKQVPFRVCLYRLPQQEHLLLFVLHHIIADLWSLELLMNDLLALYSAERQKAEPALKPLRLQYVDYVHWQKKLLSSDEGERLRRYWRTQLEGANTVLELPYDRPRPSVQTFNGASLRFKLDEALTRQLKSQAAKGGTTLYTTLLAAFQALLYRYTGQKDLLVGSLANGRGRAPFRELIGYFVNPMVMRSRFDEGTSFETLLRETRHTVLDALEHQDYPFPLLVEELQPDRSPSRSPFFQVLFVLQRTHHMEALAPLIMGVEGATTRLGEWEVEPVSLPANTAQFDLSLMMVEHEGKLVGWFEYNTDIFEQATIARLCAHFLTFLAGLAHSPQQPFSTVPLLDAAEEQQLLHDWNETARQYPSELCLHELFEQQAQRTPEATAIIFNEDQLSYAELNARANQLAAYLRRLDVGPEVRVGVLMPRSIEMVVALLAILKAGAAYVPLDPLYPPERIQFMLDDSGIAVLLTQSGIGASLTERRTPVVSLDTLREQLARESQRNISATTLPSNLAYLIYTSGSTGRPKGVMIEHRSAVAFIHWAREAFRLGADDVVLFSTSICFDLSVFELFGSLSCGSRVVLAESALQMHALGGLHGVTLVNTVPSVMAEMLSIKELPDSVQTVNLAGEPLKAELVEQLYKQKTIRSVYNLYGPSEDTTYSTCVLLERGDSEVPSIGRPIANTEIYILDREMQPVPAGVAGELYIGGQGLSRGYLRRPELTAEKFLPHRWSTKPGGRLYRTGDLASYQSNGEIQFLGRVDEQVKVRGYRIELGEIEAVLRQQAGVREAVAVAQEDNSGGKRLVCYVVAPKGTPAPAASELRDYLRSKLPDYMIPRAFVFLDSLPLSPNGKIDRQKLPLPELTRTELKNEWVAPRGPVEEALATIWKNVLNLDRVGATDNFFELGGHSLLATRVLSRLNQEFAVELPLSTIFESPTVAEMALAIAFAQVDKTRGDDMAQLLEELEQLSDEAVQRQLGGK
jgi:amino acid adenylation domain-containing protein